MSLQLAAIVVAWIYVLWVLFLAVMALQHAWDTLPVAVKVLAVPAVGVAMVLDVGLNLAASAVFADIPREFTFSRRMSRYKHGDDWRTPIARWICSNLLDPFDIGGHCRA